MRSLFNNLKLHVETRERTHLELDWASILRLRANTEEPKPKIDKI